MADDNMATVRTVLHPAWIRHSGATIHGIFSSEKAAHADTGGGQVAKVPGHAEQAGWILGVVTSSDLALVMHGVFNEFAHAESYARDIGGEVRLIRFWEGDGEAAVDTDIYRVLD